jgi:3-isopropylmalate/(R)-2-methylmalate dehydratase small subunit
MLEGLDAISLTLQHEKEISDYESRMPEWMAHGTK